jgi:hypothetical protein
MAKGRRGGVLALVGTLPVSDLIASEVHFRDLSQGERDFLPEAVK